MTKRDAMSVAIGLVVGAVLVGGLWWALSGDDSDQISSYDECVAAGYPIAESNPPQCHVPGGQSFTGPEITPEPSESAGEPTTEPTQEPTTTYTSPKGVSIIVTSPVSDAIVSSPIEVAGQVPGTWSFEASFPLEVRDADGKLLGEGYTTLGEDWMTEELVEFTGTIEFSTPSTDTGTLVLLKANAEGSEQFDDSVEIPIRFR